jgi:hypothetical protein
MIKSAVWGERGRPSLMSDIRSLASNRFMIGSQRRAARVNAPLIAESMTGPPVSPSMGCDRFSASTVTT